ncbi:MAG: MoxR family ATPase [Spirochaetales bacterium]|jgi:MoxR-like ATPase|nr:MoxR family ATPase [Spirochaetales bacterium]
MDTPTLPKQAHKEAQQTRQHITTVSSEISKAIVGHEEIIEGVLVCLLCGGHALIEGVPGLGKTYLIKTLGYVLGLATSRIQFTPDLMPADIIGTNVLTQDEGGKQHITFQKGPIFAQIILADEINRATPKTQAALLEAMQEQNVTVGGTSYQLDLPFMVLATQNPIEMEGTYPLPEAQLDRFFYKLSVRFPEAAHIAEIVNRTTGESLPELRQVLSRENILAMRHLIREIPVADAVRDYAVQIVLATHPESEAATEMARKYVRYGSSPRGAQSLILAGKVLALIDGRYHVGFEDIKKAVLPALRHRIILSFEGEAEGISADSVLKDVIGKLPEA